MGYPNNQTHQIVKQINDKLLWSQYANSVRTPSQFGEIELTVEPTATGTFEVQGGIPFPRNLLADTSTLRLTDANGNGVQASFSVSLYYRDWTTSATTSIRSVKVSFTGTFTTGVVQKFYLRYGSANVDSKSDAGLYSGFVSYRNHIQYGNVNAPTYDYDGTQWGMATEDIIEPQAYIACPAEWMATCPEIHGPFLPFNDPDQLTTAMTWYLHGCESITNECGDHVTIGNLMAFMVNDAVGAAIGVDNAETYSVWLFDRATTIGQMYLMTGDVKWLRQFHRATEFYYQYVVGGFFKLKSSVDDIKYSYIKAVTLLS